MRLSMSFEMLINASIFEKASSLAGHRCVTTVTDRWPTRGEEQEEDVSSTASDAASDAGGRGERAEREEEGDAEREEERAERAEREGGGTRVRGPPTRAGPGSIQCN